MAANTAVAVAACRYLRMSSRYGMKISGVSFRPAAIPMPSPCHQQVRPFDPPGVSAPAVSRSATTSSMSSRLTWPRARVCWTGSVASASAETPSVAPRRTAGRSRYPSAPNTSHVDRPRAARLASVIAHRMAVQDSTEPTAKITAANGG